MGSRHEEPVRWTDRHNEVVVARGVDWGKGVQVDERYGAHARNEGLGWVGRGLFWSRERKKWLPWLAEEGALRYKSILSRKGRRHVDRSGKREGLE